MKNLLIALATVLSIASCRSTKCATGTVIIKDSIVYKDTVVKVDVPVYIKGDSVVIYDTIHGLPKDLSAQGERKKNGTTAKYKIKDGIINVECNVDDYKDTIKDLRVKLQAKESYHSKQETVIQEKIVVKEVTPTWIKILLAAEIAAVITYASLRGWLTPVVKFGSKIIQLIFKLFK